MALPESFADLVDFGPDLVDAGELASLNSARRRATIAARRKREPIYTIVGSARPGERPDANA
jgi:hypothetical protein